MKTKIFVLLITLALTACVNSFSTGTTQLSRELVEKSLVKGKTTKDQVRALLGDPQSTTSGDMGLNLPGIPAETWTYTKTFHRDTMEKGAGYSLLHYALTNSNYDRVEVSVLIVMFDKNGRVSGHTFSTSAAGAKK